MSPTYKTEIVKPGKLESDDLVIVFMGSTGSGKSQIIDTLSGQPGRRSHGGLISTNKAIVATRVLNHERFGSRLVFVETPGSDYSSGKEILEMIDRWLPKSISLSGIVYVQRIIDSRIVGNPGRMFRGEPSAQSITLVTTMWDRVRDHDRAEGHEEVLKKEYWQPMIENGAGFERFLNTEVSAWNIISKMLEERTKFVPQVDTK
ncbi:hypothetical protein M413DRAFT_115200 [Hebeloma cylindrosporum]|uniref:G domain-containing protein n=1 Tax=Hebeloma cylindrosporum TaxID=76867 RepID=A0A0C2Z993_HEBCY|nr:hypothetical protein M413DRAFT_115200 [Hebeloma cylindrosporum h7]